MSAEVFKSSIKQGANDSNKNWSCKKCIKNTEKLKKVLYAC